MRSYLEHLIVSPGCSWSRLNRRLEDEIPFEWHHHPEFELTLTLNSRGQRFVGDHVGRYDDGDLVLIGPNLPHTWASREKVREGEPHTALVFWFSREWIEQLTTDTAELRPIHRLIDRAASGLAFDRSIGLSLAADFEAIFSRAPAQSLLSLLDLLLRISELEAQPLSATAPAQAEAGRERIDRVLQHLHQSYQEPLRMEDLAEIAALSVSGLHRLFRKHTQSNVSDYLIGLRIGEACSRLSATRQPIQHIAAEVGYASLANFNRQFRRLRGMSPRAYRASFQR